MASPGACQTHHRRVQTAASEPKRASVDTARAPAWDDKQERVRREFFVIFTAA